MKEIEKKDVKAVSGGVSLDDEPPIFPPKDPPDPAPWTDPQPTCGDTGAASAS